MNANRFLSLATSVRKVQAAKVCQVCEKEPNLKWRCLQCELTMCKNCQNCHQKFISTKGHIIIDIKDISKYEICSSSNPDLAKLKCKEHTGQKACLFCQNCQELVCQTCITNTQRRHDFVEIFEEYKKILQTIKNKQKNVEKEIQTLNNSKEFLGQQTITRKSYYDKVKQDILEDERNLVAEIKKNTVKLFNELDSKLETFSKFIGEKDDQLTEKLTKSLEQHKEICNLYLPTYAQNVFTFSDSLFVSADAKFSFKSLSFNKVAHFKCGEKHKLNQVLGELEDCNTPYTTELQIRKQFETELDTVNILVPCPDGSVLISDSNTIQKVEPNGDILYLRVKTNVDMNVDDAAFLPNGDLLLAIDGSSNLKLLPFYSTKIQDSVYTVSSRELSAVHVTCDNKVIVAAVNSQGHGEVIVMDQTGNKTNHFGCPSFFQSLNPFSKPVFEDERLINITSDSKSMIAVVVDFPAPSYKFKVVILDNEGKLKKVYRGHPDVNNEDNPFRPGVITATPSDNFVVADIFTHTLHILNNEGAFITLFNTQIIGILQPRSLAFSSTGQLYIGCDNSKYKQEKAKIYVVDNFFH